MKTSALFYFRANWISSFENIGSFLQFFCSQLLQKCINLNAFYILVFASAETLGLLTLRPLGPDHIGYFMKFLFVYDNIFVVHNNFCKNATVRIFIFSK
jgi:hypothetical protein